ncbi:MAG: hypothetical protein MK538_13195 [Planctomycetes bacterium]|nr:hypothetical protein [Planctomycetota bacterium]
MMNHASSPEGRDLRSKIRERMTTIRSAELACRLDTVQVVNLSTIRKLIQEAVEEAITAIGPTIGAEKKQLLAESEKVFRRKSKALQGEKPNTEAQSPELKNELCETRRLFAEEGSAEVAKKEKALYDQGMTRLEKSLARILNRAVRAGSVEAGLEKNLRDLIASIAEEERHRIKSELEDERRERTELLEKKIVRLAASLERTCEERNSAREELQQLKSADVRVGNVMQPGLSTSDQSRKRKFLLLKEVADQNRAFRDAIREKNARARQLV